MLAMDIIRVVPNIHSSHLEESRDFYIDLLGFHVAMDMGFIVTLASPSHPKAQISILRGEHALPPQTNISLSIEVGDVVEIHQRAVDRGLDILYPLTLEPWGVRRFWVADPDGTVLNIMSHIVPHDGPTTHSPAHDIQP
jgi:catechol 2,3-dioxygenase-like lactoylglutathione lyase family enzyme